MRVRQLLLRVLAVGTIVVSLLAVPPEAQATHLEQCQICLHSQFQCPFDISIYGTACETQCGEWTYPGACREGPNNGCYNDAVAIVCYEPM